MTAEAAVSEAVDWAIGQNLLECYIKEQHQKAIEDASNLLKKNISAETIAECIGLPIQQILRLQKQIAVAG